MSELGVARAWMRTIVIDEDGNTQVNPWVGNATVKIGKLTIGNLLIGQAGSATGGFLYVMVGSANLAASSINLDDDRLQGTLAAHTTAHEYIGNANRKTLYSAAATATGVALSSSDWVASTTTIDCVTYHYLLQGYTEFDATDLNGTAPPGVPYVRYGLNTNIATPASVTGLNGFMLNELHDTVVNYKTTSNTIRVEINLRV